MERFADTTVKPGARRIVSATVRRYEWVHTGIGMAGNLTFFVGSLLFLREATQDAGVWLFIVGSAGMFVGSVGAAAVRHHREHHDR